MSSSGDSPRPVTCSHCGQVNDLAARQPPGETGGESAKQTPATVCSKCGAEMLAAAAGGPLSPFDDLFDDHGEPQWSERSTSGQLAADEPLQFPEDVDPLSIEPAHTLTPLESEPPGHFDFAEAAAAEAVAPTGRAESPVAAEAAPSTAAAADDANLPWGAIDELTEETSQPAAATRPLSPIFSTGGPAAEDSNQPLRIEGLESAGPPESMTGVRCRICDTLIYVQRNQLGQQVKCPECYSEVLAEEAVARKSTPGGFPQQFGDNVVWTSAPTAGNASSAGDDEYRLSEPVERPKVEIPSHYGLEAENVDLLAPLGPAGANDKPPEARPQSEPAPDRNEQNASHPRHPARPVAAAQPGAERWKAGPEGPPSATGKQGTRASGPAGAASRSGRGSPAASSAGSGGLPPYWQQKPARPQPETTAGDDVTNKGMELNLDDLSAPGPALRDWLLRMLVDPRLWVSSGLAIGALGVGYWLLGLASGWLGAADGRSLGTTLLALLLGLPGAACFLFGMAAAAVLAALLFHLGARKQPQLSAWQGSAYAEWGPAVGFVAFAFWLGVLPGAVVGLLLAAVSGAPLWIYALSALSGTLLAPLLLASVCRSDSPFMVLDRKIVGQIRFESVDWLKFLPGSLLAFGVFLCGTLMLLIPGIIGSFLGAAGQVAGWVVFGSLTGLYCGLLVEKVNTEESRK